MVKPLNRREFLGATTVAGASLLLNACKSGPAANTATGKLAEHDVIHIALAGYGEEGKVLLESLLNIAGVRIVALCDIWDYHLNEGLRYLQKLGNEVHGYNDFDDMLAQEKNLNAVVLATPDFVHAPMTNASLRAGLHVYCEKMMSNTIEGARSMVQTMRETGKLLQIGHQRRSNPRYLFTKNRLLQEAQFCGRLTAAQAQWNRAVKEDFGFPKKYEIPAERLARYGYKDMHQFRNWRWYKGLGGGPLSDLGAHQIDIFNWWLGTPKSVMASGGLDYYKNHDWYDNAMVIYEYPMAEGVARAFYQVQTTTSAGGGYFESFMGDDGTIKMSEDPSLCAIYREARARGVSWDDLTQKGYVRLKETAAADSAKVDVRETAQLEQYDIPVFFDKPPHQPHLENFFNAIRGTAQLNCPAEEAFSSEYVIHKANEAIAAQKQIAITVEEVKA
jgi:predicted dehydrogenase